MLWVFAALACAPNDALDRQHPVGSGDDTATGVVDDLRDDTGNDGPCGNGIDESGNGTPDGCEWSGEQVLEGTSLHSSSGISSMGATLAVCDANGDGVDDVVTSAPEASEAVYVFYGPIRGDRDVRNADYTLTGTRGGYVGWSIDCRRDIDGDGVADMIVGELRGHERTGRVTYSGAVYLVPGGGTGTLSIDDGASSRWIGLGQGDALGFQVVAIDADGDETDELAVALGAQDDVYGQFGIAYLLEDEGPGVSDADAAAAYVYGEQGDRIGGTVGNAGDLDGDGVEELVISGSNDVSDELLVFGAPLVGPIANSDADIRIVSDSSDPVQWNGIGHADLDADGDDDLFVGDMQYDNGHGAAFAFFAPIADGTHTDAAEMRILGTPDLYQAGSGVTSPGDVDGDGAADLLVAASYSGIVLLQYGGGPGVYDLASAQAWWRKNEDSYVSAGWALGAGDVTADGVVDFLIGAPWSPTSVVDIPGSVTIMPSFDL